jgi:hypothetical protein
LIENQTKSNVSVVAVNKCNGSRCFATRNVSVKKVKSLHVYAQLYDNPRKVSLFTVLAPPFFNYEPFLFWPLHFSTTCKFYSNPKKIWLNYPLQHTIWKNTTPSITIPTTTHQHGPTTTHHFEKYHPLNNHTNNNYRHFDNYSTPYSYFILDYIYNLFTNMDPSSTHTLPTFNDEPICIKPFITKLLPHIIYKPQHSHTHHGHDTRNHIIISLLIRC